MSEKIERAVARALHPELWSDVATEFYGEEALHMLREEALLKGKAAIEAHTEALKEDGMVIAPREADFEARKRMSQALTQFDQKYSHIPLSAFRSVYHVALEEPQQ